MLLHRLAPPRPPKPSFSRTIQATISPNTGHFQLHFYVPNDYVLQQRLRRKRFPVVVNFHGGGFTLGTASDDARWAQCVVSQVNAVVVAVDYRLAPEHAFPTPVEDGVDAVKYITEHCEDLLIDPDRMAISGFSSGGNMTFTVPLRMQEETIMTRRKSKDLFIISESHQLKIKALCAWYPPTDYTVTREERRATCLRKDQELPAMFTNLFDESYLQPPTLDMAHPYLSPGKAPTDMLAKLPEDIIMYTCEWDMLLAEGEKMRDRLRNDFGKNVRYRMVPGVPHGWDKAPNPLKVTPGVWDHYLNACKDLKEVLRTPKGAKPRRFSTFMSV
ncbi:alpha/beta-hydrolase [Pseudovirgaria hyperparasitica]|uniref:Alpha/beta-hydrolase n=1 Tax=Pseudovirgaria hyperparasitica TaxID=470096 RepID=A0A6A6WGU6_9PEZI|nr:alpha/beta-hydrolase [Pseudovirgaria hyperparasitica]KAF2761304.1 alpha/beta-hydrolase [Pseudovirgaria hyperparasitica]